MSLITTKLLLRNMKGNLVLPSAPVEEGPMWAVSYIAAKGRVLVATRDIPARTVVLQDTSLVR
jgi:hypothetical protein